MITLRRLSVLLWAAALCPAPGALQAHDEREPREISSKDREDREPREDNSGRGSGHEDPSEREERSGKDEDRETKRSGGRDNGRERAGRERRSEALRLERDLRGDERVRGEVIVVGRRSDIDTLRAAGFTILESSTLTTIDADIARLSVPEGRPIDSVLDELRQRMPEASVAVNTVFRTSGDAGGQAPVAGKPPAAAPAGVAIGIIDTGIEPSTRALRAALREVRGFASGVYVPRAHGTAVADIAAREGVAIVSADVFGVDENAAPAATTVALAQSIDWLAAYGVRVINISIVGPENPVLARIVQRAVSGGVAVVAAAGNEGPASPPGFPAAYPGVIAVTAVDERGAVYRRANRGPHISFAARGVNVAVMRPDGGGARESGTSFAAPVVSAALARHVASNPGESVGAAVSALAATARDLGKPGRDEIFGWGEISRAGKPFRRDIGYSAIERERTVRRQAAGEITAASAGSTRLMIFASLTATFPPQRSCRFPHAP